MKKQKIHMMALILSICLLLTSIPNYAQSKSLYTLKELSEMSTESMIQVIETIKWNQISDLFTLTEGAIQFYSDPVIMDAIVKTLADKATKFTNGDTLDLSTFVEVIRSGLYLGYYNQELKFLLDDSFLKSLDPVFEGFLRNKNLGFGSPEQDEVLSSLGLLISNAKVTPEIIHGITPIIEDYVNQYHTYIKSPSKNKAFYDLISGVDYQIKANVYYKGIEPEKSPFYRNMDAYVNQFEKLVTQNTIVEGQEESILNNALYQLGYLGKFHTDSTKAHHAITKALKNSVPYSEYFYIGAETLEKNYKGIDGNGEKIDYKKLLEQGKSIYLPNQYEFDNGKIKIQAGDRVTEDKINRLYWSTKEVKSQFFSAYGTHSALEPGNADDVLTVVIYNSPKEYAMNRIFNGIDTNNGGMYIEPQGTFYTYERTSSESIYTLEELFRHEYTHYLQGRYIGPGMWGQSEIYKNERLTWYEEGGAEFFAGATRTEGVLPRKSMVGGLLGTEDRWYSAQKTLSSKYGSFEFYQYANYMIDYLFNYDKNTFDDLAQAIKTGNVPTYDDTIERLSKDLAFNSNYQMHMKSLKEKYDTLTIPLVADDYIKSHSYKAFDAVAKDIQAQLPLKERRVSVLKSQLFNTFELSGVYETAEKDYSKVINPFLKQMESLEWSGYKTLTAYAIPCDNGFEITIHGILTASQEEAEHYVFTDEAKEDHRFTDMMDTLYSNKPVSFNYTGSEGRYVIALDVIQEGELKLNLDGQARGIHMALLKENEEEYKGFVTKVEETEKLNTQVTKGRYFLVLYHTEAKAFGNLTLSANDLVSKVALEPNLPEPTSPDTAQLIQLGDLKVAHLNDDSHTHFYKIEATEGQTFSVKLMSEKIEGLAWVVYKASDMNQYYAYGTYEDSSQNMIGNFICDRPGIYYIVVYQHKAGIHPYQIRLTQ